MIEFVATIFGMIVCIGIMIFLWMYLRAEYNHYHNHEAPTVGSYARHFQLLKQNIHFDANTTLIDLWCGDGWVLRFLHKHYAFSTLVWVDNNRMAIFLGKIKNKLFGIHSIDLIYWDMQSIDISSYDYIYLFLLPEHLDKIQDWLQKNMKNSAIIVCNTFSFSNWKTDKEIHNEKTWSTIYFYSRP